MPIADKTSVAERNAMYAGGSLQETVADRMVKAMGDRAERKARDVISDGKYESVTASVEDPSGSIVSYDGTEYWRLQVGYGVSSDTLGFEIHSPTDGDQSIDSGQTIGAGWHHVAVTFDSSRTDEIEIIYDGSSVHTASVTDWGSGNTRFGMMGVESVATSYNGSITSGETESWGGRVDEVLYLVGRALTATEVSNLQSAPALFQDDSNAVYKYAFESDSLDDDTGNSTKAELQSGADLSTWGRYGKALDLGGGTGEYVSIDHSHSTSGKTDNFTIAAWINAGSIERSQLKEAESFLIFGMALKRMNLRLTKKGGAQRRTGTVDNENDLMSASEIESYADEAYGEGLRILEDYVADEEEREASVVYAM